MVECFGIAHQECLGCGINVEAGHWLEGRNGRNLQNSGTFVHVRKAKARDGSGCPAVQIDHAVCFCNAELFSFTNGAKACCGNKYGDIRLFGLQFLCQNIEAVWIAQIQRNGDNGLACELLQFKKTFFASGNDPELCNGRIVSQLADKLFAKAAGSTCNQCCFHGNTSLFAETGFDGCDIPRSADAVDDNSKYDAYNANGL